MLLWLTLPMSAGFLCLLAAPGEPRQSQSMVLTEAYNSVHGQGHMRLGSRPIGPGHTPA